MDGMEYVRAFLAGGAVCAAVQVLMDRTRLMPGRIMVLLVVSGAVMGFFGIYDGFIRWGGAGAQVLLPGFGNTLWKGVRDGLKENGLLGVFQGGFTAGSAGICAALAGGYLVSRFSGPAMKN